MTKDTARVTFFPSGATAEVTRGSTLLDAAVEAGVLIATICGGDGICGRCRVIVRSGEVDAEPTALLSREEIRAGYTLACETRVIGDVEIDVPAETGGEGAQILSDADAERFRALSSAAGAGPSFALDPIVRKIFLQIPPPTLQDNLGCSERLFREVRRGTDAPSMQMGLKVVRSLPDVLREGNWQVTVTLGRRGDTEAVIQVEKGDRTDRVLGLVVDVGTSTVVAHLVDLTTGETLDAEARYNSQMPYGAEVTRRIIHAEREGPDALREAIVRDINDLTNLLVSRSGVELHDIIAAFASGNTTMLHFLLGLNPAHIRKSPYIPATTAPPAVRAAETGVRINPRGLLYAMPSIGSWVGGDVTAGILSTGLADSPKLTMFIDVGTNGEIVLGNSDWMLACATSAGPAFEGSGVKCGMRASRGAIERVAFRTANVIEFGVIGDAAPVGICGSGLIDAIAGLFEAGLVDRSGQLLPDRSPRIRSCDGILEFVLVPSTETGADIVVTQADIENVLRAKAAVFAGAKILLESTEHSFADLDQLLIAGGFGSYLDIGKAVTLGMIPELPLDRIRYVGNTSLRGAKMALLSSAALARSQEIARSATYYDLITFPDYYEEFMSAKFLPHTDLDLFPTARAAASAGTASRKEAG
ncbi:DUF4445 domain-containing protein [Candidatus Bipolaricaulota bacterium]|nr:DUF4445 domain-containing protein [Candidatus Bipolaricaulota bacterium]